MDGQNILIAGDTSIEELATLLADLLEGDPVETDDGFVWGGAWFIGDFERTGVYYVDDFGLPLSRYRFGVSAHSWDHFEWAAKAYEILETQTDLELLWLTNMQRLVKERTLSVVE